MRTLRVRDCEWSMHASLVRDLAVYDQWVGAHCEHTEEPRHAFASMIPIIVSGCQIKLLHWILKKRHRS